MGKIYKLLQKAKSLDNFHYRLYHLIERMFYFLKGVLLMEFNKYKKMIVEISKMDNEEFNHLLAESSLLLNQQYHIEAPADHHQVLKLKQ